MTFTWSRLMSAATASYGVYALADPRHLGRALTDNEPEQAGFDLLARTYGARDLTVSALGLLGRSPRTVTTAMLIRIACDVSDGLLLAARAEDEQTRTKVLGVTFGWGALNALALLQDRRAARLTARP
ncbi:hypothetical protein [Nocardioides mesophilus]|uniref:DUF4267 domain-containing protein n=1 Tax=Nocardioides mesophilus TaxID=433659 RepID=A0A7G9RG61_9ACTN|nr:hypothetical protein [Nocardioides mesophilus]QNN54586.1 hypothetical protein H9L09_09930 [Nocardioides mesophilus]